jgi:hypothetical protein
MITSFFRALSLITCCAAWFACGPAQKIRLNTNAIPDGKTFSYQQTTTSTTTLENSEEKTVTSEKNIQHFTYTLLQKNPDGSSSWMANITHYQTSNRKGDAVFYFDTDHLEIEQDPVKALVFKKLVHSPFRFTVQPDGVISDMKGMDELWKAVSDSIEPAKKPAFEMMMQQFGDQFLADAIKNTWSFYPPKAIRKGKRWKKESVIALFNAKSHVSYHLDDIFANEVAISSSTVIKGDPKAPGEIKMGPAKINYFLNGQGTGNIHLDPTFGMIITSEALLLLEGKMEIKVPYLAAQAMPITIKTKVLLEQQ